MIIQTTDNQFKNIYYNQPGLVIGRGNGHDYKHDSTIDFFSGIKIGCNSAYEIATLDLLIWMDTLFFVENWQKIKGLNCLRFAVNPSIYCDNYGVDVYELKVSGIEGCSESFDKGFYPCELSGYLALNMALIMGLNPIWLHGFTSDMKNQYGMVRSDKFKYLSDWAKENNREIYLAQKKSYLKKFFDYKELPQEEIIINESKNKSDISLLAGTE